MSELREEDIRIDVFTSGINCPVAVKLTHMPTGFSVEGKGKSQYLLVRELKDKLAELVRQEKNKCS